MHLAQNLPLKDLNSFGISCRAAYLRAFRNISELKEILSSQENKLIKKMVLGGGSNILFTQNYNGLILLNEIMGIEKLNETQETITYRIGSGENWHSIVSFFVENNWGGLENLSLIPGKVGAAPMQNIGAYGVEQKDCFIELSALEINTLNEVVFKNSDCNFGYRESFFKAAGKGKYIITSVTYQLSKNPKINTAYGVINQELDKMGILNPSIKDVAEAVIAIRKSKLPDPKIIGNAGSFFKNPVIPNVIFEILKSNYPEIVAYPAEKGFTKIAAGWLIEQAGWKGYREGDAGVHKNQALVLVNYGNASGNEIKALAEKIIEDVMAKFGVRLETEVNII
jgi:UDP-N-acetylmuramate dehydrogenase